MWNQHGAQPISTEWFGLYENLEVALSKWVASARYVKEFRYSLVQFSTEFMSTFPKFIVGLRCFTLAEMKLNATIVEPLTAVLGWMSCVWVDKLSEGSAHIQFTMLYGKLDQLFFGPTR